MSQTSTKTYVRKAMKADLLEKEEELELARRWRDHKDESALHKLINAYGRLVISMVTKFKHYGIARSDLIQEGQIGLLEAANRFDPDRELRFSTYASWWIRSYLQDYVLRNWSIVRTGTTSAHKSLFFNFRRLRNQLEGEQEQDFLTDTNRETIANKLGVKLKDVKTMENRLSAGDQSLNATVGSDESTTLDWQAMLTDERATPEAATQNRHDGYVRRRMLAEALGQLDKREEMIMRKRALSDETVTLEALGKTLGVSKERVRQLESRAKQKLKTHLYEKTGGNVAMLFAEAD